MENGMNGEMGGIFVGEVYGYLVKMTYNSDVL
jgi:hypothetical protein